MKDRIRWSLRWQGFEREWYELGVKERLRFWGERSGLKDFYSATNLHEKLVEDVQPDEQARSNYSTEKNGRQQQSQGWRIHHLHLRYRHLKTNQPPPSLPSPDQTAAVSL